MAEAGPAPSASGTAGVAGTSAPRGDRHHLSAGANRAAQPLRTTCFVRRWAQAKPQLGKNAGEPSELIFSRIILSIRRQWPVRGQDTFESRTRAQLLLGRAHNGTTLCRNHTTRYEIMPDSKTEANMSETIGQVVRQLVRRRWWLMTPTLIITLAVIAYVAQLPNQYRSEATLVVVQQQVSQRYVEAMSTTPTPDIVNTMKREILSRSQILSIVEAFGLYPQFRDKLAPEQLAEKMRSDVSVDPLDQVPGRFDFTAFKISFVASSPGLAQEVTSRLTSLFIEKNLKLRGNQAETTTKFINEQLQEAKQRLAQQEARLQSFKMSNYGALPGQEQSTLGSMTDLRIQLQTTTASLSRVAQQRTSLESMLRGSIARLQTEKTSLLTRLKPRHPEVLNKEQELTKAEALLARLKTGRAGVQQPDSPSGQEDPLIAQLTTQVEAALSETQSLLADQQRLKAEIEQLQGQLRLAPVKEQQLTGILRDYELYRQDYSDLVSKQLRSQLSASLEEQQGGQTFRLVDAPSRPVAPTGPARLKISLMGLAAGLALGAALVFLTAFRDSSFYSESEVRRSFDVPLLVSIPMIRSESEERKISRKKTLEWVAGSMVVLTLLAAEYYVYRSG